jgi:2-(1,2-epoxy-1,2-dihydrophenyl)acetyl-CoA isomerase
MAPAPALVSYERRGAAGWLTLNRPHKRNALVPALLGDLHRALDACDADPRVRATVVTGAGGAFCAGADLGYLTGKLDEPDGCEQFIAGLLRPLAAALARLRESPRPVIAAVNGACFAGGLELLAAARLAALPLPAARQVIGCLLCPYVGERKPDDSWAGLAGPVT